MRYFAELAYKGTAYVGWQRQPNGMSVQEKLEETLSMLLREPVEITGCGRTDTGVHAAQYFIHFDFDGEFPEAFLRRLNKVLPPDIAVYRIFEVAPDAHARYDAYHRAYRYTIIYRKDPFLTETAFLYPYPQKPDLVLMQSAADLLLQYEDFFPFCKSDTDTESMRCELKQAEWNLDEATGLLIFDIAANRFLRGMVRLIVGACINVGIGQVSLEELKHAMDTQTRLKKSYSVPPEGLALTGVRYIMA